ncbi:Acidic leucine-rich nuclear phosphoprotein 32 family member E [Dissostichus eleginoides]|uniref:Acidic leucine-rich nuclear phosphoprotein 32 family member n=1 Tax=Dissostichus eleginoides TaxID=100907 RepID=A0AAD9B2K4_DISEL|nr:Acidic leucine-rich nuclear phosphoprotein 32 family member E [Dissostichus eleginoides]
MDMKKRITLELRNRGPAEIAELVVDNSRSADGQVEGLTDAFTELEFLSMVNVGLSSLSKLPSGAERQQPVRLSGDAVNLKSLQSLDLFNCEITSLEDYRESVFELLPQVTFLDGFDQEDNEAPDSEGDDDARGIGASARGIGASARGIGASARGIGASARGIGASARGIGLSSGYRSLSSGYRSLSSGYRSLSSGYRSLSSGYRSLSSGYRAQLGVSGAQLGVSGAQLGVSGVSSGIGGSARGIGGSARGIGGSGSRRKTLRSTI